MCPVLFHFPVWPMLMLIGVTIGLWAAERLKLAGWRSVASCVAGAMAVVAIGHSKEWLQQSIPVQGYGTLMLCGFLLGVWMARRRSPILGIEPRHCIDLGLWSVLGGLIGARIFHVVNFWPDYDPWGPAGSHGFYKIVALWEGGLVFFGALIGGPLAAMLYCLWHRLPVLAFVDLVIPGLIAGQAFGRLGCLMRGCCFGRLTDDPLALSFPSESEVFIHQELHKLIPETASHSLAVIPAQLYASIGAALTGAFLYAYWPRRRFDGEIIGWVFLMAAVTRFFEEFLRNEPAAFPAWSNSLTIAQWFAFVLIVAGVLWLWFFGRRGTLYRPKMPSPQSQPGRTPPKRRAK
jgi:phosphatidylglycerol:prolipoprotein diacylglycerol transferase